MLHCHRRRNRCRHTLLQLSTGGFNILFDAIHFFFVAHRSYMPGIPSAGWVMPLCRLGSRPRVDEGRSS
jgi:hypothetical protein